MWGTSLSRRPSPADQKFYELTDHASGFLGSHVVERAVLAGHRVRVLVRHTSKAERLERSGVDIIRGDLKNPESLCQAVAGMDAVINAASSMDGISQETEAATIKGTRDLLSAAELAGVRRFIHISSIGIYGVHSLSPGATITENSPLEKHPKFTSDYVRSKIASETAALEFAARAK